MSHPLQTKTWAEVREKQGSKIHWVQDQLLIEKPTPKPFKNLGIMSQVEASKLNLQQLKEFGSENKFSHIQIDPNEPRTEFEFVKSDIQKFHMKRADSLLLRHTQIIDLKKDDDTLLEEMDKNWRYNCKYALRKGVRVEFTNEESRVEDFIRLYYKSVDAKGFLGRNPDYFREVWQAMSSAGKAILVFGYIEDKIAVSRMLFLHEDTIYTAYTGTSRDRKLSKYKAAYGVLWEIMRWGRENGYKQINMWGVEPDVDKNHPHYGFTQFKLGFGGKIVELAPAYDLVIDMTAYRAFQIANWVRLTGIKLKNKVGW